MKRRFLIDIEADDRESIAQALRDIADTVECDENFDPDVSSDSWFALNGRFDFDYECVRERGACEDSAEAVLGREIAILSGVDPQSL